MVFGVVLTRTARCGVVAVVACAANLSLAQSTSNGQTESETVATLIRGLGAPAFSQREQASRQLLALGNAARDQLSAIGNDASPETRKRVDWILARIETEDLEKVASSFLLDPDASASHGLPAWSQFRELAGDSRTSKLLFLESVKCQRELLTEIESFSTQQIATPESQRHLAAVASNAAILIQREQMSMSEPRIGDFVGLLLATSTFERTTPILVTETIETHVDRFIFTQFLHKQGYGSCLKKMLAVWVPKTHDSIAPRMMDLSLRHDIPSVVAIARQQLLPTRDTQTRHLALSCLLRFGNESDLPLIASMLSDRAIVYSWTADDMRSFSGNSQIEVFNDPPPGYQEDNSVPAQRFVVQMRDIALATILHLSGESHPEKYFPGYRASSVDGFDRYSIATPLGQDELHDQRIELWKRENALPASVPQ